MRLSFIALLLVAAIGCSKDTITNTIENGATPVGDITGQVALYDTAGVLVNHAGATVALDNTSYSTTTDSSGYWTLKNVPAGTYTISFSKEGFSSMKDFNISFNGNGTLYYQFSKQYGFSPTHLRQIISGTPTLSPPTFQDLIQARDSSYFDSLGIKRYVTLYDTTLNYYVAFKASFGVTLEENRNRGVLLLFGKTSSVSAFEPSTYLSGATANQSRQEAGGYYFSVGVNKDDLYYAGFSVGQTVYYIAYCGSMTSINQFYFDPVLKNTIYTGVGKGHSEVKSFICP